MEYRKLPHGEENIGAIGIGTAGIQASSESDIEKIIQYAVEQGVNYFDMASAEAKPFEPYGRALSGIRDRVYFQIYLSAGRLRIWGSKGTYGYVPPM